MSLFDRLEVRSCPVCGADAGHSTIFLEASFDPARLTNASFASRKVPEFMSYRLVRCTDCATVYATAAPPAAARTTVATKMSEIVLWNGDKRIQTQVLPVADDTVGIRSLDWDRDRFDIEFG